MIALPDFQKHFDERRRDAFLAKHDWEIVAPVGEDMAFRRYFRVAQNGETAILMDSLPDDHPDATPGHRISDFIRIGDWLRDHDLHAPQIYEIDDEQGFLILEDFGDISFRKAIDNGAPRGPVYSFATDVLKHLRAQEPTIELPDYYESPVHLKRRRVIDWYVPAQRREKNPDGLAERFLDVWGEIESGLPDCPRCVLHVDFHLENLMWVPEAEGLEVCGILDYQSAMIGPGPYDLVNLLDDARIDVPENIRKAMLERYCFDMRPDERKAFMDWYAVLAAQFHCRVIGQFIRFAVWGDKPRYLEYMPIVAKHLKRHLQNPLLKPLDAFFKEEKIDLETLPEFDIDAIRAVIRDDAV